MKRWCVIVLSGWLVTGLGVEVRGQTVASELAQHAGNATSLNTPQAVEAADARIQDIFLSTDGTQYAQGVGLYLDLLTQLDRPLAPSEDAILRKHVLALLLVLPEAEREALALDEDFAEADLQSLPEGTGQRLAQWWRQQDGFPATENNERLEEHLRRVALASERYGWKEDPRGFDDRGAIYVRLGLPSRSTTLGNRSPEMRMQPAHGRIPNNEFWVYNHVAYDAYYLFIQRGARSPYKLSETSELLRHRSLEYMEEVLGQLALHHTAFGAAYDAVTLHLTMPPRDAPSAERFAWEVLADVRAQDVEQEYARATDVPVSYSGTRGFRETLDVPMRWARFLEPDGTTRTELYWTLDGATLEPSSRLVRRLEKQGQEPSAQYLMSLAITQYTAAFEHRKKDRKHYLVPAQDRVRFPTLTYVAQGDTGLYHVGLQWDQQWVLQEEERLEPGVQLKVGVQRLDSLQALHSGGRQLELSDLKPLAYQSGQAVEAASPYPYTHWQTGTDLALYFEVYHLAYTASGETQYTVAYEVTRQPRRRGRLLARRSRDRITTTEARYIGQSRTAQEYIVIAWDDWEGDGDLQVTVRVTDETTSAQKSRTLTFSAKP